MITVLTGTNHFQVKKELEALRQAFISKHGEPGVEVLDGTQLEVEQMKAVLTGASLFASDKFVVIKNISQSKDLSEQFLSIANDIPKEVRVILQEEGIDKRTSFYKTLKKEHEVIEFGEPSEQEVLKWISQKIKDEGGTISNSATQTLLRYIGTDQTQLLNEIQKLVSYNQEVSLETIEELVEKRPEDTVFQLLDATLSGRKEEALKILENLERSHEDPFAVANMLIWQTHILAVVSAAGNRPDSEISKQTKINPYVIQKTKRLTTRLSQKAINTIIESIAELDIKLKTSSVKPWRLLEQTILSL